MTKRPARYTVRPTVHGCTLTLYGDHQSDHAGILATSSEHHFAVVGSYVYDVTYRPGSSGRQVCETLFGLGSTLHARPSTLTAKIRLLARRYCDAYDREWNRD